MDSALESADRVKAIYGDRCRILRRQGDYELMIRVELANKIFVHVDVPSTIETASQLDVFVRGCAGFEIQDRLEQTLRLALANTSVVAIDELLSSAEHWIKENLPQSTTQIPSSSDESSKKKSKKQKSSNKSDDSDSPLASRKPAMKTAFDVISRLKWDSSLASEHFVIGYLDRFTGIIEKPFSEFNWTDDFVDVDLETDFAVPQHRIQYFKYKNAIVWDKKERFDAIFNSGGCRASLDEIIRSEDTRDAQEDGKE